MNLPTTLHPLRVRDDPTRGWLLVLTLLIFLLPGTLQRDPWKQEDAIFFGVAWRAIESGNFTHFHLSTSLLAEPPLYHWLSSLTGNLLQGVLGAPAAIRLATLLFVGIAALALYLAARRWYAEKFCGTAPLALAGALGLLVAAHDVQPLTSVLASLSILLLGISHAETPKKGGLLIALGIGGTLLGGGLRLLPALLITLAATLMSRQRGITSSVALGIAGGTSLLGAWWLTLHHQSPTVAWEWFGAEIGQFSMPALLPQMLWNEIVTLSWFAWPAWPLAFYALWSRRRLIAENAYRIPAFMTFGVALTLAFSTSLRQAWLITLLPPMTLLAVPGVETLRRGGIGLLDWFGRMTLGLLMVALALGWTAMTFGWPAKWAAKSARWAPGYVGQIEWIALFIAVTVIAGWIVICWRYPRSAQKSLFAWSGGLAACWCVIVALWLPWFDHQRSYRTMGQQVSERVKKPSCINAKNLGEAQFALFDYYVVAPLSRKSTGTGDCAYTLIQGRPELEIAPEGLWRKVWEGGRPGDRNERYRLYVKL